MLKQTVGSTACISILSYSVILSHSAVVHKRLNFAATFGEDLFTQFVST